MFPIVSLLIQIAVSQAATVTWRPNSAFDIPTNFDNGELPCSKKTVIFPESLTDAIKIQSMISVKEFILPQEGEIILDDAVIQFGEDANDSECVEGNVNFLKNTVSSWLQAGVWSSDTFNEATPDAERIPCFNDIVEFPTEAQFTVMLPDQEQKINGIMLNGNKINHEMQLFFMVNDGLSIKSTQKLVPNNNGLMGLTISPRSCHSISGCPCQEGEIANIDCSTRTCSIPTCMDPIRPIGHCCKICGAALDFLFETGFKLAQFKAFVDKTVDSYGRDDFVYHVGRLPSNKVQVVIVEKGDYKGTSGEIAKNIEYYMDKNWVRASSALTSGIPLSSVGMGWKITISMFFVVVGFMSLVYVYYYKLPSIQMAIPSRSHRSGGITRFQRRTDSVVTLTRRDSTESVPAATSFRNPMYDSTRARGSVTESDN